MPFQKPSCLALILCEAVIEDKLTNNKSLIGLFNQVQAHQLPIIHAKMCIVISLSGGHGKVPITLKMSSLSTGEDVFQAAGEVVFNDPLSVCDLVFELRQVPFKTEGAYAINVFYNNIPLIERRFLVTVARGK